MKITLTKETKAMILRWLAAGAIDRDELQDLARDAPKKTPEEMEADYLRMQKSMYPDFCKLMHGGGLCALCEDRGELCKVATNHLLCGEMPDFLAKALGCRTDNCPHNRRRAK